MASWSRCETKYQSSVTTNNSFGRRAAPATSPGFFPLPEAKVTLRPMLSTGSPLRKSPSSGSSGAIKILIPVDEPLNALFDRRLGLKADISHQRVDIRKCARHIAGLQRQHVLDRFLA